MVFFRRRGLLEKKKTIWKKYTVAYSGTAVNVTIGEGSRSTSESTVYYYTDGFNFPESGNPTLSGRTILRVMYVSSKNANVLKGKLFSDLFFGTQDNATSKQSVDTYYVYKKGIRVTAATARSLAIAGDYIEDVESEDPNAYPDNGPLGLYFYIKQ